MSNAIYDGIKKVSAKYEKKMQEAKNKEKNNAESAFTSGV